MKTRNLLFTAMLSVMTLAVVESVNAQQDTIAPQNNTAMNKYSYLPETYQRGSSTSAVKMFPNPARSQTTLYINSIQEKDKGEVVVYNNRGKIVLRNPVTPGNNDLNVSSFSTGTYTVKIFTKDKSIYTQQLLVMN